MSLFFLFFKLIPDIWSSSSLCCCCCTDSCNPSNVFFLYNWLITRKSENTNKSISLVLINHTTLKSIPTQPFDHRLIDSKLKTKNTTICRKKNMERMNVFKDHFNWILTWILSSFLLENKDQKANKSGSNNGFIHIFTQKLKEKWVIFWIVSF